MTAPCSYCGTSRRHAPGCRARRRGTARCACGATAAHGGQCAHCRHEQQRRSATGGRKPNDAAKGPPEYQALKAPLVEEHAARVAAELARQQQKGGGW